MFMLLNSSSSSASPGGGGSSSQAARGGGPRPKKGGFFEDLVLNLNFTINVAEIDLSHDKVGSIRKEESEKVLLHIRYKISLYN